MKEMSSERNCAASAEVMLRPLVAHITCPFAKATIDALLLMSENHPQQEGETNTANNIMWLGPQRLPTDRFLATTLIPQLKLLEKEDEGTVNLLWVLLHARGELGPETTADEWLSVLRLLHKLGVHGPTHPLVIASGEAVAALRENQEEERMQKRSELLHACLQLGMGPRIISKLVQRKPYLVPAGWSVFRVIPTSFTKEGCVGHSALLALDLFGHLAFVSPDVSTIAASEATISRLRESDAGFSFEHVAQDAWGGHRVTRGKYALSSLFWVREEIERSRGGENGGAANFVGIDQVYLCGLNDIIATLHAIRVVEDDCKRAIGDVATDECHRAVGFALSCVLSALEDDVEDVAPASFQKCAEQVGAFLHAVEYDDRSDILEELDRILATGIVGA